MPVMELSGDDSNPLSSDLHNKYSLFPVYGSENRNTFGPHLVNVHECEPKNEMGFDEIEVNYARKTF
jgi:hypothetical protein